MDEAPNTAVVPVTGEPAAPAPALELAQAADSYRRYPGEEVTFYTRVRVNEAMSGFRLQVSLDAGLIPGDAICTTDGQVPRVAITGNPSLAITVEPGGATNVLSGANHFIWDVTGDLAAGAEYQYTIKATIAQVDEDWMFASRAVVWPPNADDDDPPAGEETVHVAVSAQGRYVKFLPALYQEDELMGRFLMLFESFWQPITSQTDQMDVYLDPRLTQAELLPWLASWIGLTLDERWPEERRRNLLNSAVTLFRRRGTKRGLQDYLEVYTGVRPQIIEHGANNFRLGPEARLGPSIALGTSNQPHTFQVSLSLPPIANGHDEAERQRLEAQRRRMIDNIIDAEKPAHTDYTLHLEVAGQ
jgi:phage tail-like protein